MKITFLLLFVLCTFGGIAQTISTDAPSISAGASTVPKKVFQVESNISLRDGSGYEEYTIGLPTNLFRIGLCQRFELRMTNGAFLQKDQGVTRVFFDDIRVGSKYAILNNPKKKTQIAFLSDIAIPRNNAPHYKRLSFNSNFAINHQIHSDHSIGYNLGYGYSKTTLSSLFSEIHTINYSLIYSYQFLPKLGMFAEAFGTLSHTDQSFISIDSDPTLGIDFGFLYLLKDNIQIDYSFGMGISDLWIYHGVGFNFMLSPKN